MSNESQTEKVGHVERIEDALEEINHLEYNDVSECPSPDADVRVRVADHMKNALVNNGEFAQFHQAGYVGHHVEFEEQYIDLRSVNGESDE